MASSILTKRPISAGVHLLIPALMGNYSSAGRSRMKSFVQIGAFTWLVMWTVLRGEHSSGSAQLLGGLVKKWRGVVERHEWKWDNEETSAAALGSVNRLSPLIKTARCAIKRKAKSRLPYGPRTLRLWTPLGPLFFVPLPRSLLAASPALSRGPQMAETIFQPSLCLCCCPPRRSHKRPWLQFNRLLQ